MGRGEVGLQEKGVRMIVASPLDVLPPGLRVRVSA